MKNKTICLQDLKKTLLSVYLSIILKTAILQVIWKLY